MERKVHITEPEERCTKLESFCCSMCAGESARTVLYVCESGHVVCDACRKSDEGVSSLHTCDSKNLKTVSNMKKYKGQDKQGKRDHEIVNDFYDEDFASGDHNHCSKCFHRRSKSKSNNNIQEDKKLLSSKTVFSEKGLVIKNTETILKYRNEKLSVGESSTPCPGIKFCKNITKSGNYIQRPVTCPLTVCRKMIARDFILQHFYFDHSKVPRITLNSQPHRNFLNASLFSENTSCYAVFLLTTEQICASLLHTTDAGILLNGGYKNVSFLLMGVRMPCISTETIMKPHGSDSASITLPLMENKAIKMESSKIYLNPAITTEEPDKCDSEKNILNKNNAIMLWICKIGDKAYYYTISVSRADMKLGYSFTGETMKIEDSPIEIFDQMECLLIQENSLKKLVNEQNELEISVNIFD
ncbi:uncharacterized protein isoform X1 [Choristoneura fumiferana]|uniref:uncharacterized protein isoform X1 n=3 Tax=Choristoneura fumiferana TaxID=7141 RepID=UPI003D153EFA